MEYWNIGILEKWKNGKDKLRVAGCEFKVTKCRLQVPGLKEEHVRI
jgi:hypothetical protein